MNPITRVPAFANAPVRSVTHLAYLYDTVLVGLNFNDLSRLWGSINEFRQIPLRSVVGIGVAVFLRAMQKQLVAIRHHNERIFTISCGHWRDTHLANTFVPLHSSAIPASVLSGDQRIRLLDWPRCAHFVIVKGSRLDRGGFFPVISLTRNNDTNG